MFKMLKYVSKKTNNHITLNNAFNNFKLNLQTNQAFQFMTNNKQQYNQLSSSLLLNSNPFINTPFFNIAKKYLSTKDSPKDNLEDAFMNHEKNLGIAKEKMEKLIVVLKSNKKDEDNIFKLIEELVQVPTNISTNDKFNQVFVDSIDSIPLTKNNSFKQLFLLFERLDINTSEPSFNKISKKVSSYVNNFDVDTLTNAIYAFSKYRVTDSKIWSNFENMVIRSIDALNISNTSKVLIAFTMVGHQNKNFYLKLFTNIEKNLKDLQFLDTFRICMALTKKLVDYNDVKPVIWANIQDNFVTNIKNFDLFQVSQIALLLCETPYVNLDVFDSIEKDIMKEYLEQVKDIINENKGKQDLNLEGFFDDLSKVSFAFAITRKGSAMFWKKFFQTCITIKDSMSTLALENILFVIYRTTDLFNMHDKEAFENQVIKEYNELVSICQQKIIKEKLIENNLIDPFNCMMPFARLGINDNSIWNPLVDNIMSLIKNKDFKMNPYILSDLVFSFSNYGMSIRSLNEKELAKNSYHNHHQELWNLVEKFIISGDPTKFEVSHLANLIIDLSNVDIELDKTKNYLKNQVISRIKEIDTYNFTLICVGFSKIMNKDNDLWLVLENCAINNINSFNIDEIRKIILSFLKIGNCKLIWKKIEERLSTSDILNNMDLEMFLDLQIPLALFNLNNEKIWRKFEEHVFKNLKAFESDVELLMNTLYSFSKVNRGSKLFWDKIIGFINNDMDKYEIDDLGHIAICIKPSAVEKVNNEEFWKKFTDLVMKKLDNAKFNACNNLLKGVEENQYLSKNKGYSDVIIDGEKFLLN